jgi:hypothetical protein
MLIIKAWQRRSRRIFPGKLRDVGHVHLLDDSVGSYFIAKSSADAIELVRRFRD